MQTVLFILVSGLLFVACGICSHIGLNNYSTDWATEQMVSRERILFGHMTIEFPRSKIII